MCARYDLQKVDSDLAEVFALAQTPRLVPRFNIAPTQQVPIVRVGPGALRRLDLVRWGLVPPWAGDPKIGVKIINARAETAAAKPAFRNAMRHRRCLVPATGFFEWREEGGVKQPHRITRTDGRVFAFAGLWEADRHGLETCTILTTEANETVRPLHDRMPVILAPADHALWLDPAVTDAAAVAPLLVPSPAAELTTYPVSRAVGNPRNDDPRCVERV